MSNVTIPVAYLHRVAEPRRAAVVPVQLNLETRVEATRPVPRSPAPALRPDVYRAESAMMNARLSPLAKSVSRIPRVPPARARR